MIVRRLPTLRDRVTLTALILIGAVLPAAFALVSGAAEIPRNDDWSYRAIAMHLYTTGELRLDGASQSFAFGQVLAVVPLLWISGGNELSFWAAGFFFSIVVIAAGYVLARLFIGRFASVLAVLTLLLAPGYWAYSGSFMTDVPALAMVLVCLATGVRAVRSTPLRFRWALVAIATGAAAFSIRQFALGAIVAVCLGTVIANWRRGLWFTALSIGVIWVLSAFQGSLSGQVGTTPVIGGGLGRAAEVVPSLGLFVLPAVAEIFLVRPVPPTRSASLIGAWITALILLLLLIDGRGGVTIGNLFSPWGAPTRDYVIGGRPLIFDSAVWPLIQITAIVATYMLFNAVTRAAIAMSAVRTLCQTIDTLILLVFVVVTVIGIIAYALLYGVYDRYLWPLIIPLSILLFVLLPTSVAASSSRYPRLSRLRMSAAVLVVGGFSVFASLYALNSFAFDAGRWDAGERLVELGGEASETDAGYEWVGAFAPGPPMVRDYQTRPADPVVWYGAIWPAFRRCNFVSAGEVEIASFEEVTLGQPGYRQFLLFGKWMPLHLYRSVASGCRPGTEARAAR